VTVIIFALIELAPGDVADNFINPELGFSEEANAAIRDRFGLGQPAPVRYVKWLVNAGQGDFGLTFVSGEPVVDAIGRRLGNTLLLMSAAMAIGVVVGIALGVFTAVKQYSFWDISLTTLSFVGISMPAFITGILGMYLLAIRWKVFPSGGMRSVLGNSGFFDVLHHLILPAVILSLGYIATFMRYTRFSMLEVLHADYVRTAHGKGLRNRTILWRHALPNALLPVITVIGLSLPTLVVGAVFIETIFSWPGMGTMYLDAVHSKDVPLIMGMNTVIAIVVLAANLLTDLAYGLIDPRIRYD
jgi:peptide/nickel transport system permease protein